MIAGLPVFSHANNAERCLRCTELVLMDYEVSNFKPPVVNLSPSLNPGDMGSTNQFLMAINITQHKWLVKARENTNKVAFLNAWDSNATEAGTSHKKGSPSTRYVYRHPEGQRVASNASHSVKILCWESPLFKKFRWDIR